MWSMAPWALLFLLVGKVLAAPPLHDQVSKIVSREDGSNTAASADTAGEGYTTFNDIMVPPLKEIQGSNLKETIRDGYW